MKIEAIPNLSQNVSSGAGIQAAQTVASKGAKVLITGNVGPNAFQALSSAGINVVTGVFGTVKEAVERFKSGQLQGTTAPSTPMGFVVGRGYPGARQSYQPHPPQTEYGLSPPMLIHHGLDIDKVTLRHNTAAGTAIPLHTPVQHRPDMAIAHAIFRTRPGKVV